MRIEDLEEQAQRRTVFLTEMREEFPETFEFRETDEKAFQLLISEFPTMIDNFQEFVKWLKFHVHFSKYFGHEPTEQQLGGFYNQITNLMRSPRLLETFEAQYAMRENDYGFYIAMNNKSALEKYAEPVPDFHSIYRGKRKKS